MKVTTTLMALVGAAAAAPFAEYKDESYGYPASTPVSTNLSSIQRKHWLLT